MTKVKPTLTFPSCTRWFMNEFSLPDRGQADWAEVGKLDYKNYQLLAFFCRERAVRNIQFIPTDEGTFDAAIHFDDGEFFSITGAQSAALGDLIPRIVTRLLDEDLFGG